MNIHSLRDAQAKFEIQIEKILKIREKSHRLRVSFIKHFNKDKILTMEVDEYVTGKKDTNDYTFCYILERKLDGLGRITAAPPHKFGIYYGLNGKDSEQDYYFVKRFGDTKEIAFQNIQKSIINLIDDGEQNNLESIVRNKISPMIKGKILSTYFPNKYLNIFSPDHLDHFLVQLNIDNKKLIASDAIWKRQALVDFKNHDEVMKSWSLDLFAHFLYVGYPGGPIKANNLGIAVTDPLADYRIPSFPAIFRAEYIDFDMIPSIMPNASKLLQPEVPEFKLNYEKEGRKLKSLGDRGEKIVFDLEMQKLEDAGLCNLAKSVDWVSKKSDAYGYDIHSFDLEEKEIKIEVKATTGKVGKTSFFISAHELNIALQSENYFIYIVFEVATKNPKVWRIKNPFKNELNITKTPINFRIDINGK